ncbi:MAG: 5'/3'-nucleotidase SurE [Clostridia bacterium]|nr:5'/3'-nucleotidase SurE [Clostridia bacterium]
MAVRQMKIAITNDDGIQGEGIRRLVQWAQKLGEVWVFAPKVEQSAKSHAIEIHKPFEAKETTFPGAARAWAVDSTPADCIRFAILGLHEQFDLVISGVNRGLNIGQDIMYSGTVSAVFEAGALGTCGLALSTDPESFDDAFAHLDAVWSYLTEHNLFSRNRLWNVNIPMGTTGEFRLTRQGGPYYSDDFGPLENDMYTPLGKPVWVTRNDETLDTDTVLHYRHISVTPLTIDRTNLAVFDELTE